MKDVTDKIGTPYFDLNLRLTPDQLDEVVKQELMAQLHSPQGIPDKVIQAMIEVLIWYAPNSVEVHDELSWGIDCDWKEFIQ